jgi:hypothetical protein
VIVAPSDTTKDGNPPDLTVEGEDTQEVGIDGEGVPVHIPKDAPWVATGKL